jgi:glycine oxidase
MPRPSDIVVVGAGIIGCAVAYELARRGASVQLVDQRHAGQGATQASAGILAPYIEAETGDFLSLTVRSLHLYDRFVSQVVSDSALEVAYRRTGTLQVATDHDRMTTLRNIAASLDRQGVELGVLDAQMARAEEPHLGGDVAGGLLVPTHGFVSAEDLTRALTAAARHHGAQLMEGGRVRCIARCGSDLAVETDRGRLTGTAVVLAAGSWSGQIEIEGVQTRIPIRPVRGQLIRLAWNGPTVRRVTWGDRCYLVPWDDGTLLVGATVEDAGFDEHTTVAGIRDLLDAACELVPHAWTASFLGARAGLRPASGDDLPILGPSRVLPNLMYATGHYRNGILLAPLTAQLVADALLENIIDPTMRTFGPGRFGEL